MITIENLTKQYDGFSLKLSLSVPKGRVTGLVGKNGAGKSTAIKAILGLITPDSGTVRVFGKDASALTGRDRERMGVTLAESGFSIGGSFIVGYLCLLSTTLAVGTVSHDDADNGLLFLLTCPVSRREYVLSKYLLCGIVLAVSWILSVGFLFALDLVKGVPFRPEKDLAEAAVFLPGILLSFCLMIPVQLKYGPENGRMVILLLVGGVAGLGLFLTKALDGRIDAQALAAFADSVPAAAWAAAGIGLSALAAAVSVGISVRILQNKAF